LFQYGQSLFREKAQRLLHRRSHSLHNQVSAAELVDMAYLWLLTCYWRIGPHETLRHLVRKALHQALQKIGREKNGHAEKLSPRLTDSHAPNPADLLESNEARELIVQAIEKLPEQDREIIRWRFFENQTLNAIAERMHVSPASVGRHLHQAMDVLRTQLQE
jgi:RNA polymerase sigma factor (sigma-70 family)